MLCCFAGEQGGPPGACDTCRFGGQLHYLADREWVCRLQLAGALIAALAYVFGATAELGSESFEPQVIGDFPEAEARLYLEQTLGASITDAKWAEVFEVCVHACIKSHSLFCRLFIVKCNGGIARRLQCAALLLGHM